MRAFRNNSLDDSDHRQSIAFALHQKRQAKCREVRAASLAVTGTVDNTTPSSTLYGQVAGPRSVSVDPRSNGDVDVVREFYRTPTLLAEDPGFSAVDRSNAAESLDDVFGAGTAPPQVFVRADSEDVAGPPDQDPFTDEVFVNPALFDSSGPLWIPPPADRRTPTLPWCQEDQDLEDQAPAVQQRPQEQARPAPSLGEVGRRSSKARRAPPPPPQPPAGQMTPPEETGSGWSSPDLT